MRLVLLLLALGALFAAPLLVVGEELDKTLAGDGPADWLRACGPWAWAAGVGLLVADLLLPVPATAVMTSLGIVYGPLPGGLIAACGSFLAGTAGYTATRLLGRRATLFLVGQRDLIRAAAFFERAGGWAVALSRPLPILPEIIACLAGLTRMPADRFFPALACGSLPFGLAFAAFGAAGSARPVTAILISALAPLLLWLVVRRLLLRQKRPPAPVSVPPPAGGELRQGPDSSRA